MARKFGIIIYPVIYILSVNQYVLGDMEPVRVSGGLLQGVAAADGSYTAYYGVPYASVIKRFQASKPNPTWKGVKIANNADKKCLQRLTSNSTTGEEDCLTLNVYVPSLPTSEHRSVMVFIHGGAFKDGSGSPSRFGPKYLIKQEVILVTINYRLDILGFLCLGIKEAPGNIGLKDQVEAFKWVKQNIEAFGGDPDNVTLFGQSTGSASVMYHLLSPMSNGLFHKVIMESGTPLSFSLFQYDPIDIAHRFAAQLSQDTYDLQELVTILNNKTNAELLLTRVPRKIGDVVQSETIFAPCIENEISGVERFLDDYPFKLISKGQYYKVPIIIGFNSEEGYRFVSRENKTTIKNLNFFDALPSNLDFPSIKIKKETAYAMNALYLPKETISSKTLDKFAVYNGDSYITFPVASTIEMLLKTNDKPVYAYKFTHNGTLNIPKIESGFAQYPGATHTDEIYYLFSNNMTNKKVPRRDKDIIQIMTTLWTRFAKSSDPTPTTSDLIPLRWVPATPSDTLVFVIDNEMTYEPLFNSEQLLFWNTTYSHYRRTE